MHRKIPSLTFSFTKEATATDGSVVASVPLPSPDERPRSSSRSRLRGRSLSPFRSRRSDSAEGIRKEGGEESETDGEPVSGRNAFESSESETESEWDEEDEQLEKNTEANSAVTLAGEILPKEGITITYPGEGPNLLPPSEIPSQFAAARPLRRRNTKSKIVVPLALVSHRPTFEKNRVSVVLTHGDPDKAGQGRRTRNYLVASDLSDESLFAIQWAIGTVLRDGDECLIVSVIETDTKFDPEDANPSSSEKKAKIVNQRERQANALMLSRQATALLERTRLSVRIVCQSIHAKNARHMLVDMIDFHEPTMVIIGSRGLTRIKGMLLGSVSNYLIQKSSSPVMVTRRPLRLTRTVHKKLSSLNRESRMPLAEAAIDKESHGGDIDGDPNEPLDVAEQISKMEISSK